MSPDWGTGEVEEEFLCETAVCMLRRSVSQAGDPTRKKWELIHVPDRLSRRER